MIDKNKLDELMYEEIQYLCDWANCTNGQVKENYKAEIRDLMMAIAQKDWQLYNKCQAYLLENYDRSRDEELERESETFSR